MNLDRLQRLFQNAWLNMNKQKCIVVFISLCLGGLLAVFSRVIAIYANAWTSLSLAFAPIFILGGLLFTLGVFLVSSYNHPQKKYTAIIKESWKTLISVCYLTLPMLLLTLLAWFVLGVFFLIKEIPVAGEYIGVMLSFAPFILILMTLLLVFVNLVALFFVTPSLAKKTTLSLKNFSQITQKIFQNPLLSLLSFFIAALPLCVVLFWLISAALLTQASYLTSRQPMLIALKWFFLMLPFNALLTPATIFFFNFSAETDNFLSESLKESEQLS